MKTNKLILQKRNKNYLLENQGDLLELISFWGEFMGNVTDTCLVAIVQLISDEFPYDLPTRLARV